MKRTIRLSLGLIFASAISIALFAFAMFEGDRLSWFLFFAYLPIYLYELGMFFDPLSRWQVRRSLSSHHAQAGDSINVELAVERKWVFPIFYCIVEEVFSDSFNHIGLGKQAYQNLDQETVKYRRMKRMLFPFFSRKLKLGYEVKQLPRGEHEFYGVRIRTSDLFGLIKKEYMFPAQDLLSVRPNELPVSMLQAEQVAVGGAAASHSLHAASNMAAGIRPYVNGDRLAAIDWKQTARRQALMTKEFEQETSSDTMVFLDGCAYEKMNRNAFEVSIEVALGLARLLERGKTAKLAVVSEEAAIFPLDGEPGQMALLSELTQLQPGSRFPFALKLREELQKARNGLHIIVITANLNDMLKDVVMQAAQKGQHFLLVHIAPGGKAKTESIRQLALSGVRTYSLTEQELSKSAAEVEIR